MFISINIETSVNVKLFSLPKGDVINCKSILLEHVVFQMFLLALFIGVCWRISTERSTYII